MRKKKCPSCKYGQLSVTLNNAFTYDRIRDMWIHIKGIEHLECDLCFYMKPSPKHLALLKQVVSGNASLTRTIVKAYLQTNIVDIYVEDNISLRHLKAAVEYVKNDPLGPNVIVVPQRMPSSCR